jgi:hypothetical protein
MTKPFLYFGRCADCVHDYFVAFSCKGRGVCPSCNTCRLMPFSMAWLRKAGSTLVYRCAKQHSEPGGDRRGPRADEFTLTQLELIKRIAALV